MTEIKNKTAGPRISTVPIEEVPTVSRKRASKLEPLISVVETTPAGRAVKIACDSEREVRKLKASLYAITHSRGIRVGLRIEGTTLYAYLRTAAKTTAKGHKGPQ